jgi:tyrosine-protein phosphatase YwqE
VWNIFSKKKTESVPVISPLRVDIHSHLIPAIDDGAQTDDDALALITGLYGAGYRKLITTPHVYGGLYDNNPSTILPGLKRLQDICSLNSLTVEIEAAAEYFFDNDFFELIEKKELLTFGDQYVLFELPMNQQPAMLEDIAFQINSAGYKPVLAHPERYLYFHDLDMHEYQNLKDHGVYFQLNLMSLTGYYNEGIKRAARDLVKHQMVDFAGTDMHRQKHINIIHAVQHDKFYLDLLSSGKLLNNTL